MLGGVAKSLRATWWFAAFNGLLGLFVSVMSASNGLTLASFFGFFINVAASMFGYAFIFSLVDAVVSAIRKRAGADILWTQLGSRVRGYFLWLGLFSIVGFGPLVVIPLIG